jgi:hypothetical protein
VFQHDKVTKPSLHDARDDIEKSFFFFKKHARQLQDLNERMEKLERNVSALVQWQQTTEMRDQPHSLADEAVGGNEVMRNGGGGDDPYDDSDTEVRKFPSENLKISKETFYFNNFHFFRLQN